MGQGAFLKLVYDDEYVLEIIHSSTNKGAVKKIEVISTDRVEYFNEDGGCIAVAQEESRYHDFPMVKIREYHGDDIGHAYVRVNGTGTPNVDFYREYGNKIGERFFDYSYLAEMNPRYSDSGTGGSGKTGSGGTGSGKTGGGGTGGGGTGGGGTGGGGTGGGGTGGGGTGGGGTGGGGTGGGGTGGGGTGDGIGCSTYLLIFLGLFLCAVLGRNFEKLDGIYFRAYEILGIVQLIVTKLACPIVLVLCLFFVPFPKGKNSGAVIFYLFLVLFTAATFVPVSIQLDRMLQPFGLGIEGWNNVKFFLLSLLPGLVYALLCSVLAKMTRKSQNHDFFCQQIVRATTVYFVLAFIFIFGSRMIAAYVWQYTPYESGGMLYMVRFMWYLFLTGIGTVVFLRCVKEDVEREMRNSP